MQKIQIVLRSYCIHTNANAEDAQNSDDAVQALLARRRRRRIRVTENARDEWSVRRHGIRGRSHIGAILRSAHDVVTVVLDHAVVVAAVGSLRRSPAFMCSAPTPIESGHGKSSAKMQKQRVCSAAQSVYYHVENVSRVENEKR